MPAVTSPSDDLRTLVADGLVLRPYTEDDLGDLIRAFADPLIVAWNPGPGTEPGSVRDYMRRRNDWDDGTHLSWCIADPGGQLLGAVSVHSIDREQEDGEVGYWVAPWGRGHHVAARAVQIVAATAFGEAALHRLHLLHAVDNEASCRVAARAGFLLEGHLRRSYRYGNGDYHDEHLHARLATDAPVG